MHLRVIDFVFFLVNCSAGTQPNDAKTDCVLCPEGQYKAKAGPHPCNICPKNKTTLEDGALMKNECIGMYWVLPLSFLNIIKVQNHDIEQNCVCSCLRFILLYVFYILYISDELALGVLFKAFKHNKSALRRTRFR